MYLPRFLARRIKLYRPIVLMRICQGWPEHQTLDLRAKLLGVRVPVLWAYDEIMRHRSER